TDGTMGLNEGKEPGGSMMRRLVAKPGEWMDGFLVGWGARHPVPAEAASEKLHHAVNGFRNPHPHARHNFRDFFRWQLRLGEKDPVIVPRRELPRRYAPPMVEPDLQMLWNPDPKILQVTWIGHTTFLIQAGGMNVLTDPIFSERCSPVRFAGPRRKSPPALHPSQLPPIDAVVI